MAFANLIWTAVVALTAFSVLRVHATPTGAIVAISNQGLKTVIGDIEPALAQALGNLKIPDYKTSHIHLQNMRTEGFDCDSPCIKAEFGNGNSLQISILSFKLKFHVRYSIHEIISTGGVCDGEIKGASASASTNIDISDGTLKLGSIQSSVNPGSLDPKCKGISGSIIDALAKVFKSTISNAIKDAAKKALGDQLTSQVNKVLKNIVWTVPFADKFAQANFIPSSVASNAQSLSVGVTGDVTPIGKSGALPPFSVPSMPTWDPSASSAYVQVMLSAWSLESYTYTYYQGGRLDRIITHSDIGSLSPVQLNTSSMSLFAPGLKTKYPNRWMQLEMKAVGPPVADISTSSGLKVVMPASLSFQVLNESGGVLAEAFSLGANVTAAIKTSVVGGSTQRISGQVTSLSAPFQVVRTSVGPVRLVNGLSNFTNFLLDDVVVPIVNKALAQGFPLPSVSGFSLTSTTLAEKNGYLLVGSQFKL